MPKHYKEVVEDIINKMNEANAFRSPVRYSVKFSMRKGGEIRKASYRDKEGAERFKKMVERKSFYW